MKPEYMTPEQTSAFLNVPVATLAKWRYLGCGPVYQRFSYRVVRYPTADLQRWLKQNRHQPTGRAS